MSISGQGTRTALRTSAITAGTALMMMTIAAFFSYGYVHTSLLVQGDAAATLQNILSHSHLLKAEIFGWVIILICDIVVAWACYIFFSPVHKNLAVLSAWLRLGYTSLLGIAVMNLLFVLLMITSQTEPDLPVIASNQLVAQVMLHLKAFDSIWSVGLLVFGGHLLMLGILALKSNDVPRWIGILLVFASIGYVLIHLCALFFSEYTGIRKILNFVFLAPMTAGEMGFGLWLLFRGGSS